MFERLKKQPAYLQVYNAIEAEILSDRLQEGSPLPTEAELCAQLGVTRATVREGLRLLEQADLVQRGAAKRFYVKRPNTDDIAAATRKSFVLGGATFQDVWETLLTMYPPATKLAAKKLKRSHTAELRRIRERLKKTPADDEAAVVVLAVEFFQSIAAALGNNVMLALLQSLNMMIGASLEQVIRKTPNAHKRITDAQERIIDAIEKGDGEAAADWMKKHINDLKRGYSIAGVSLSERVV